MASKKPHRPRQQPTIKGITRIGVSSAVLPVFHDCIRRESERWDVSGSWVLFRSAAETLRHVYPKLDRALREMDLDYRPRRASVRLRLINR